MSLSIPFNVNLTRQKTGGKGKKMEKTIPTIVFLLMAINTSRTIIPQLI
jgi:hypothetical protein